MTKEEFKNKVFGTFNHEDYRCPILREAFKVFFDSNVCIPKGDKRHPCADELHQIVENTSLPYLVAAAEGYSWADGHTIHVTKYRIKQKEPVYEWQWAYNRNFGDAALSEYMTEEEAKDKCVGYNAVKIDFTQRERK